MRGRFVLVVAAGVALAIGWSLVRRAAEGTSPEPLPRDDLQANPPGGDDARDPSARLVPVPAEAPPPADPMAAARALLAGGEAQLGDVDVRANWVAAAESLLARADAATSRDGTEARILARKLYAGIYTCDSASSAECDAAFTRSTTLFESLIRGNGAPATLVLRHQVQQGQSVWALARGPWKQAGATAAPGFVLWLNGVADARRVRAGQTLKVPLEPVTVLVRKQRFELTVLLGGSPIERFRVAVGPEAKTPVGKFTIRDCLRNPDWYQNGRRIPFGSPGHIIGTRWLGFSGAPEADGIGIHGTTDEASIGTTASQGCVRMKNADVERLFEWVTTGTTVDVRD